MSENETTQPESEPTEVLAAEAESATVEVEGVEITEVVEVIEADPADTAAINAAVARSVEDVAIAETTAEAEGLAALGLTEQAPVEAVVETTAPVAEAQSWAPPAEQVAPAPGFAPEPPVQAVYVQAPVPPKPKSNRWFAVMVTAIGSVLFAALYAGISYIYMSVTGTARAFESFLEAPVFWGPVLAFFVAWALLGIIVNRGPWWTHAVFGLLVGVLVYFSWIGFALITRHAWAMTSAEASEFLRQQWLSPYALIAALTAREIPIWLGGWVARNGRKVTARNEAALDAYEREVAAGPVFS